MSLIYTTHSIWDCSHKQNWWKTKFFSWERYFKRKTMPTYLCLNVCICFWIIPKKGNAKECSNYHTIALISHTSKVMLKILQVRLQHYVNRELPDVQAGFRKGRGTRDQIVNICWTSLSALLTMLKPLTVWFTINCGKFWKRWECQTTWPASWETCIQVRKQQLELDMEQQINSK